MKQWVRGAGVFWALLMVLGSPAGADELAIPGTGACEAVLHRLAAVFAAEQPGDRVTVPPSVGSGGGIRAVIQGEAVLARVARRLAAEEEAAGITFQPFAQDAVVFATGRAAGVEGLTAVDLEGVFAGRLRRWSELGGADRPIRVFVREPGDASLTLLAAHLPWFASPTFAPKSRMLYHDSEMVQMLTQYPTGVGWLTTSTLVDQSGVVPLPLDGVAPTPAHLADGSYPVIITYGFALRGESLPPVAARFLRFVASPKGAQVLAGYGLVPVRAR